MSPAALRRETPAVEAAAPSFAALRGRSLLVGVAGFVALLAGGLLDPPQFYRSYLIGYSLWLGIALGCLGILMLQHLSGGAWGVVLRRLLEAAAMTLPFLFVLFTPLLSGLRRLYPWADEKLVAADPILRHKSAYLNPVGFTLRAVVYFAIWSALAIVLNRWSDRQDRTGDPLLVDRLAKLSGAGIALYVLAMTFASVDWMMSLEPHWFSTLYGLLVVMGQALSALAFAILVLASLAARPPLRGRIGPRHFHDLGKLLLAFVMVWTYFAFSQFLIIWAGNLPEEIPWYLKRLTGGWQWFGLALAVFQFAFPFVLLLSMRLKRNPRRLAQVAGLLLLTRLLDVAWTIAPAFHPGRLAIHWMDLAAPVAVGGIWLALFLRFLERKPLLPLGDPFLKESIDDAR
ncbi:MAG TPA: hypothetical protein VGR67_09500 [Candidatus Polarisedimenticolia bacterium]|jgi:hypothetical protein|nr:hypothetical protein [Candidatus Polarisedimenticolia bacterium]